MDGTYDAQAGTRFPTTKWREGYDVASVDEFVARAERAVSFRDGRCAPRTWSRSGSHRCGGVRATTWTPSAPTWSNLRAS